MSKLGKMPVKIEDNTKIEDKGDIWVVTGPKGSITINKIKGINVEVADKEINVSVANEELENGSAYWGLIRSLINNAVIGVNEGFTKELELVGVGYRVEKTGKGIKLSVGYSHPVEYDAPEGIVFDLEGNTGIKVSGIDKQLVGQVSAEIRGVRKPEPYKGKGIKYKDEVVRRKQGKAAK